MPLGGHRIARQHGDEGCGLVQGCRRHRRAKGVQMGFSPVQCDLRDRGLILHGIEASHARRIPACPPGGSRSRLDNPHSAVFLLPPALGPTEQPTRASRVCRSVAAGRSICRACWAARCQASSAAPISHDSSAWRPAVAGLGRAPARRGHGRTGCDNSGSASSDLFGCPVRVEVQLRHQSFSQRVRARCASSPWVAAMRCASSSVAMAFSSCPASANAVPRLV